MSAWSGIGQFPKRDKDDYVIVAAIHLGTTFSGYAFSFKTTQSEIKIGKNWGENLGFQSSKTPTSVLLDENCSFKAFGFEAEELYSDDYDQPGYQMYRHFKMMLHKTGVSRRSTLTSTSGKEHSALEIFSMALKYIKDHMLDVLAKIKDNGPSPESIKWVLTVPAIWDDEAKQFMREAAYKGGLIKRPDSQMLLTVSEPEAASLYCRSLFECEDFAVGEALEPDDFKPGMKYLVIDAGKTIDMTVFEVLQNDQVKQLHSYGIPYGGTNVDENFIKLLNDVVGSEFVTTCQSQGTQLWLTFMRHFEQAKRSARPGHEDKIALPIDYNMAVIYREITGSNLEQVIKQTSKKGVAFGNGSLILKAEVVSGLFDPVMKSIVSQIKTLMQNRSLGKIDLFLLVGGFGECTFLQESIKESFGQIAKILVPSEACMSVLKGAVHFGHRSTDMKGRISKKVDGNSKCSNPDSSKPDGQYLIIEDQKVITVPIYTTDQQGSASSAKFPDTPGLEQVGGLELEMSGSGEDCKLNVKVIFGGNEIQVSAKDKGSGKAASTSTNLMTK